MFDAWSGAYGVLAGELSALGVARVRLSTKPQNLATDLAYVENVKAFNRAMHGRSIEVAGLYLQTYTLLEDPLEVESRTGAMLDFNAGLFGGIAPGEAFDALDVDVEPVQHPSWGGATWSEKDALVQQLLDNVVSVAKHTVDAAGADLPLSVGVMHFFHDRVNEGDLTVGKASDFLDAGADVVSLFAYDDDLSGVVSKVLEELSETAVPHSIQVVIKTKDDGNDDQTFFEEGCSTLRTTVFELMGTLPVLHPVDNVFPTIGVFELDSMLELCLPGGPYC